jgi:uncharacterized repeat protein (TIGR03803 family)
MRRQLVTALLFSVGVASPAFAQYTLSTLATFNSNSGIVPVGSLIADTDGNLYGVTELGGTSNNGTVFKVDASTHILTTLATFNGNNGANPYSGLIADASGNLYGTTKNGGTNNEGTVFELAAGTHALSTLATFNNTNGAFPESSLIADASGNLYGTTDGGGTNFSGTVFEVASGTHAVTTLAKFDFSSPDSNGANPEGGLVADANGNLYGTTYSAGADDAGTVFEVAAGTHALTTLATFNGSNGQNPRWGSLTIDSGGNLYGATTEGGNLSLSGGNGDGTVFEIAAGTHALTDLVQFNGTDGEDPGSTLIIDSSGNLYGTTALGGANEIPGDPFDSSGTVFEVAVGTHALTTLFSFNEYDGGVPSGGLLADANGNLYGLTGQGGSGFITDFEPGGGTLFELQPIGVPEPASAGLLAMGSLALLRRDRRAFCRR